MYVSSARTINTIKLFLVSIPKGRWTECLKNDWPWNNWGHLGDISRPGVQKCSSHTRRKLEIWWGHWQRLSRRGRSVLEDGLNNLSWETGCYELCYAMMLCCTHSFHNSRQGWKMVPPARERRSRHTGISHGESSRRPTRASNHGQPGQYGTINNRQTSSQQTLSRTPGSRAIGGKAYRWSLGHICTMASSQIWAGWLHLVHLGSTELLPNLLHHLIVEHPFLGPQPLSLQDVCSLIEAPRDVNCPQGEQFPLGPTLSMAREKSLKSSRLYLSLLKLVDNCAYSVAEQARRRNRGV